jgi:hypothetical protein
MLTFEITPLNSNNSLQIELSELQKIKKLLQSKNEIHHFEAQAIIEKTLAPYIDIFNYDVLNPPWLYKSKFEENVWFIKSSKNIKEINFEKVLIDKNKRLSDMPELLYGFKLWISISTSPKHNNGVVLKSNTILQIINRILCLIDSIILDSSFLCLSERGLSSLNNNYFIDRLLDITKNGVEIGVYNYIEKVKKYLKENISSISLEEVELFEKEYPFHYLEKNSILGLSQIEVRKSRLYLYKNKAYKVATSNKISVNSEYFHKLYKNTLVYKNMKFPLFEELNLEQNSVKREFPSIPTRSNNENLSSISIGHYIQSIELLNNVASYLKILGFSTQISIIKIEKTNILNHVHNYQPGRYTSLPSNVVFDSFRNAFEYLIKNQDHLLQSFLNLLTYYQSNKNDNIVVKYIKKKYFLSLLTSETIKSGISQWSIIKDENFFQNLRKHSSLPYAYYLMIASLSVVIGTIMARRQSEIMELDPIDSLLPKNLSPKDNPDIDFYLKIHNSKSGVGGNLNLKETLSLPIPNSIANFIYNQQLFNEKIILNNIVKKEDIKLLTTFNKHSLLINSINQTSYNHYLDYFCDFFETKTLNLDRIKSRFYIRQHQLRRFFAMLFFWSKSFDGLDSLRRFLGHTKLEHLYHYITESTPGEVLYGVKARYIFENMGLDKDHKMYIENIENLEPILKKYFDVSTFDYLTEQEASIYTSSIIHEDIKKVSTSIEEQFFILLKNHTIDLKPFFFTVTDEETGLEFGSYKLILVVNENYE